MLSDARLPELLLNSHEGCGRRRPVSREGGGIRRLRLMIRLRKVGFRGFGLGRIWAIGRMSSEAAGVHLSAARFSGDDRGAMDAVFSTPGPQRPAVAGCGNSGICPGGFRKKSTNLNALGEKIGGAEGIRTPDLCSAIAALSHLSYSPKALAF